MIFWAPLPGAEAPGFMPAPLRGWLSRHPLIAGLHRGEAEPQGERVLGRVRGALLEWGRWSRAEAGRAAGHGDAPHGVSVAVLGGGELVRAVRDVREGI